MTVELHLGDCIEIDPEYFKIAEKRIAEAQMQPRLEAL